MSRMAKSLVLLALAANTPAVLALDASKAPAEALAPAGQLKPVEVPPAESGLTDKSLRLNAMESDLALALKGLALDGANAQRNELSGKINGIRQGTNSLPELVGISGVNGVFRAQFLSGSAMVDVGVGDWVSSDWRVSRMSSSGVELSKRGSNDKHQVLFGQRPVSSREIASDIAAAANASSSYGSGGSGESRLSSSGSMAPVSIPANQ